MRVSETRRLNSPLVVKFERVDPFVAIECAIASGESESESESERVCESVCVVNE